MSPLVQAVRVSAGMQQAVSMRANSGIVASNGRGAAIPRDENASTEDRISTCPITRDEHINFGNDFTSAEIPRLAVDGIATPDKTERQYCAIALTAKLVACSAFAMSIHPPNYSSLTFPAAGSAMTAPLRCLPSPRSFSRDTRRGEDRLLSVREMRPHTRSATSA